MVSVQGGLGAVQGQRAAAVAGQKTAAQQFGGRSLTERGNGRTRLIYGNYDIYTENGNRTIVFANRNGLGEERFALGDHESVALLVREKNTVFAIIHYHNTQGGDGIVTEEWRRRSFEINEEGVKQSSEVERHPTLWLPWIPLWSST